jgi:hypothetical protein
VPETVDIDPLEQPPKRVWDRILAEPDRAPEYIALAAAERFGPQAEEWVRIAGPGHTQAELARIAMKKHVRLARIEGGALGIGGIVTAAPDLVALLWLQSRMVWYIAAAYGYDPNHPMRPAEYLALQGLYDTPAQAREGLDGVGKRLAFALAQKAVSGRHSEMLHLRLAKYVARRLARRYAGRLIPFIGAPIGAMQNGNVTGQLGRRALDYYGGEARRPERQ